MDDELIQTTNDYAILVKSKLSVVESMFFKEEYRECVTALY